MPGPGSHKYTYEVPKNSGKGTFGGAVRTTFIDLAAATSTPVTLSIFIFILWKRLIFIIRG